MEQPSKPEKGKLSKIQWLWIIGGVGVALIILSSFFQVERHVPPSEGPDLPQASPVAVSEPKQSSVDEMERKYEEELKKMLEEVVGTGRVSVMVNLDSTEELVVEKNVQDRRQKTEEKDRQGATRQVEEDSVNRQVVVYRQDNEEKPLVLMQKRPKVRGVLIIAEGAENPQLKAWILEAVQRGLNVPPHRVAILPRKNAS
ncbi:MAG: stage III sporulation protein AG [Bacillus thermozeamaize]|jgi:stage III sporulation protein AG|uniref:Stage III sporulation protein AG n=1 Tax=Bacillus thermozeamaize TaxID=230954 RepID=A0A1Y3PKH5_9BACI|nr:MAG: stage III sporulation protein AG [Bacillus thermozeamaize]